jgi:hypothetical protein
VIGMCKTGTNGGFGVCGTAASREWDTEVDSSNGLDDVMMGDDECSVGMQDRAGMGITKWLAQQGKARQGKVWAGSRRPGCMSWLWLSWLSWVEAAETADMWSGPRGLWAFSRRGQGRM